MKALLAWYFVAVWGAGYLAAKAGLQYAPRSRLEFFHLAVAGLLMHAVQLGGTHYAQYLGMSAGVVALVVWHKIDVKEVTAASLACTPVLGVSVYNYLVRHGEATRVTSMMYLPPVFAVVLELALFGSCRARSRSPAWRSPAPAWR